MNIVGLFASLFGVSCSKQTVRVEFVNAKDQSVIAVSDMLPEQLPDTFAINTTLDLQNQKWAVDKADPIQKTEFVKTGKLRVELSPVTMAPPGDILFSLATISDDIGAVAGERLPSDKIFALHEDDWRQVEFISELFSNDIQKEISDVKSIYENDRDGIGFKKVHVRERIPKPFENQRIALTELESVFRPLEKFEAVGFQRTRGIIPNSFAWKLDRHFVLWGITDNDGIITRLCIYGFPEAEKIAQVSEALSSFGNQHKLTFVDWCRATSIPPGAHNFSNYFQSASSSH